MSSFAENLWKTKASDRFVLKWIKCNLSARITPSLSRVVWLRPWMITCLSSALGIAGGLVFALGMGWLAGIIGALSQVLDGVDGQLARLTGRASKVGALLDSVLDRYSDGAMMMGLILYVVRMPGVLALWQVLVLGFLAFVGSNLVSYSGARAESLGILIGKPTLASKGTRMSVMIISGLASGLWAYIPTVALIYLTIHSNAVVVRRLMKCLDHERMK